MHPSYAHTRPRAHANRLVPRVVPQTGAATAAVASKPIAAVAAVILAPAPASMHCQHRLQHCRHHHHHDHHHRRRRRQRRGCQRRRTPSLALPSPPRHLHRHPRRRRHRRHHHRCHRHPPPSTHHRPQLLRLDDPQSGPSQPPDVDPKSRLDVPNRLRPQARAWRRLTQLLGWRYDGAGAISGTFLRRARVCRCNTPRCSKKFRCVHDVFSCTA